MSHRGVHVVIPAYQEEESLPATLRDLRSAMPEATLVVVDDGSTDATAALAEAAGARVLRLPFNLGVGAAVRTGLHDAHRCGAQQVVIVDADGQHRPEDVQRLLDALDDHDFVVGSRFLSPEADYAVGRTRAGAMRAIRRLVRLSTGLETTDPTSGFRAMRRPVAALLAREYPVEYLADTVEVLVLVARHGYRITEVPVSMRQRQGGVPSSRSLRLAIDYLRLVVGVLGSATRRPRPTELDPEMR